MISRLNQRQVQSVTPQAEAVKRDTFRESLEIVGKNAPALTLVMTIIGLASLAASMATQLKDDIDASKAECKAETALANQKSQAEIALANEKSKATNEKIESLRREIVSKIKESQAASERLAIEYQFKYKHSEEYVSLRKPSRTTAPLD